MISLGLVIAYGAAFALYVMAFGLRIMWEIVSTGIVVLFGWAVGVVMGWW